MAGYGASLTFDKDAMENLPVGRDKASAAERRNLFRLADLNGNGIVSLAECDRLIVSILAIEGVKIMKPVINRAFHAARDVVPSVGSISAHYVDFHEFRYFLIYLRHYLELFLVFCEVEHGRSKARYSDRRMSFQEFEACVPRLLEWSLDGETAELLRQDPAAVFRGIDENGGGVVLFDEFAHWALWHHMFELDGDDEGDMEEALEVLRKQKPNLCGKDLSAIKASKAKYRADAKISGQGCLGGDPSLSGGYDELPTGGAALAAGGHYPGGLGAWKASFHGQGEDKPGAYRTAAAVTAIYSGNSKKSAKIGEFHSGDSVDVVEVARNEEEGRVRGRVEKPQRGWISLLNTRNGFRWALRVRAPPGTREAGKRLDIAWKDSFARVIEASNDFEQNGIPECVNGCGQPRFGRYPTCCTHCKGPDGPHAQSCKGKGYLPCVNGCGHSQFGKYDTCCWHCKGPDGPHARSCTPAAKEQTRATEVHGKKSAQAGRQCCHGCGRRPFKHFQTCCTHCGGPGGPHARDCDARDRDEDQVRQLRAMFHRHKDRDSGFSHKRFKEVLEAIHIGEGSTDKLIAICDRNGNGVIEVDEFLDWLWSGELSTDDRDTMRAYGNMLGQQR